MKHYKIVLICLFVFSGCTASNFGDPTRPDIRKKHYKMQQENLRSQYGTK